VLIRCNYNGSSAKRVASQSASRYTATVFQIKGHGEVALSFQSLRRCTLPFQGSPWTQRELKLGLWRNNLTLL